MQVTSFASGSSYVAESGEQALSVSIAKKAQTLEGEMALKLLSATAQSGTQALAIGSSGVAIGDSVNIKV